MAQRRSAESERFLNTLGKRLRALRENAGLSGAELSRRLQRDGWDCSELVISRIETQTRSLTDVEIKRILKVLKKKWSDLD